MAFVRSLRSTAGVTQLLSSNFTKWPSGLFNLKSPTSVEYLFGKCGNDLVTPTHRNVVISYNRVAGCLDPTICSFKDRHSRVFNSVKEKEGYKQIIMLGPFIMHEQGFAKSAAPLQLQRQVNMRLYIGSPGAVLDPYKAPPPPLPFFQRWFTEQGWKLRRDWMLDQLKTAYTIAQLRKKIKYKKANFYSDVTQLYKQVNTALAQGDRTTLRQLVTENMFSVMKKEIKQRESIWGNVHWEVVGPTIKIQTLQGRLAAADQKNLDTGFVQMTLQIVSNQKFAAYDKQGKLAAGDQDKEILVKDLWVFERGFGQIDGKWRLCGRL